MDPQRNTIDEWNNAAVNKYLRGYEHKSNIVPFVLYRFSVKATVYHLFADNVMGF